MIQGSFFMVIFDYLVMGTAPYLNTVFFQVFAHFSDVRTFLLGIRALHFLHGTGAGMYYIDTVGYHAIQLLLLLAVGIGESYLAAAVTGEHGAEFQGLICILGKLFFLSVERLQAACTSTTSTDSEAAQHSYFFHDYLFLV